MKIGIGRTVCFAMVVASVTYVACFDYSDHAKADPDADAPPPDAKTTPESGVPAIPTTPLDAGACATKSFRGGAPNVVVCPGAAKCECAGPTICCLSKVTSDAGTCMALSGCRDIALQCDGPEDCDGGVCCLDDRSGGGSSCKAAASCAAGQWLCRADDDCAGAPAGSRCAPMDLGAAGVDDVGLDGIVGVCGK